MRIPTFIQSHILDSENAVLSVLKMKNSSNNNNKDNSSSNNNKDKNRVVFADSIPNSFVCPAKYIVRVIPLLFLFPPNSILL